MRAASLLLPRLTSKFLGGAFLGMAFALATTLGLAAEAPADPDKDPQMAQLMQEAFRLVNGKQPAAAVQKYDQVIAAFQAYYRGRKETIYCARSSPESLGYLLLAASEKKTAISLPPRWADAYYMRGYALVELNRRAEAKESVQRALKLSPLSSLYLNELGSIYQLEKDWPNAMAQFRKAEGHAAIAPEDSKAAELGQARRGIGYVLVELGKLEEAAKKYEECLAADPKDERARRELEYVRAQQAKRKAS